MARNFGKIKAIVEAVEARDREASQIEADIVETQARIKELNKVSGTQAISQDTRREAIKEEAALGEKLADLKKQLINHPGKTFVGNEKETIKAELQEIEKELAATRTAKHNALKDAFEKFIKAADASGSLQGDIGTFNAYARTLYGIDPVESWPGIGEVFSVDSVCWYDVKSLAEKLGVSLGQN